MLLSSIPGQQMPPGPWWRADKLIHGAEYAVLGALVVRALLRGPPRLRVPAAVVVAVVGAAIFGVVDEWHQAFTPGRDSSTFDAVADGVGGALGAVAAALYYRRRSRAAR